MTLVAEIETDGKPILVGDFFVSAKDALVPEQEKRRLEENFRVPTNTDNATLFGSDNARVPIETKQKILLLDDDLAIGYSGSLKDIESFAHQIIELHSQRGLTRDSFASFLDAQEELRSGKLRVIAWLREGERYSKHARNLEDQYKVEPYTVRSIGSGSLDLKKLLEAQEGATLSIGSQSSLGRGISTIGTLISKEHYDPASMVSEGYGGGYELLYISEGGFLKLDNITYLLWEARTDKQAGISLTPKQLIKHTYRDSLSYAILYEFPTTDGGGKQRWPFVNSPVHLKPNPDELDLSVVDINSRYLCNTYALFDEDNSLPFATFSMPVDQQSVGEVIRFTERENRIDIEGDPKLHEKQLRHMRSVLNQHPRIK